MPSREHRIRDRVKRRKGKKTFFSFSKEHEKKINSQKLRIITNNDKWKRHCELRHCELRQ